MKEDIKSGKVFIKPEKDIISSTAKGFREQVLQMITGHGCIVEINLEAVEMIDSVGLGVFIATHNALNKVEGELVVTNTPDNIYRLFKTMGLARHFKVVPAKS